MKQVLIVGSSRSQLCGAIARSLREAIRGRGQVSCYFGQLEFGDFCDHPDRIDWSTTAFVLLALSKFSQDKDHEFFALESKLLQRASDHNVPIGIVCDAFGGITTPYLQGCLIEAIQVIVTKQANAGCSPQELYSNAVVVTSTDPEPNIADIVNAVARHLPDQKIIGETVGVARRSDQAGWHQGAMTE